MHQGASGRIFYRLSVVEINLPPLRERGDDIVLLARHFLERYAVVKKSVHDFMQGALQSSGYTPRRGMFGSRQRDHRAVLCRTNRSFFLTLSFCQRPHGRRRLEVQDIDGRRHGEEMTFRQAKRRRWRSSSVNTWRTSCAATRRTSPAAARAARVGRREFVRLLRKHNLSTDPSSLPRPRADTPAFADFYSCAGRRAFPCCFEAPTSFHGLSH
jgi:hypothetical protein